jgi:glycine/D-amino acid oxidase-like deaminating enzyme/nitrite reductase/ring-hydroxylating ferredoxin subunit
MTSLWQDRRAALERRSGRIPADEFAPDERYDIAVVGAGLTGLITALLLVRAGKRVVLLESGRVGELNTGGSTAKVSLLQGTVYSRMRSETAKKNAEAYVAANREGFAWLLRYLDDHDVAYQLRDAFTYAGTAEGASSVDDEHLAAARFGLPVEKVTLDMPFPTFGAIRLADQAQIDPIEVLTALAADFRNRGGVLVEDTRVLGVAAFGGSKSGDTRVKTARGAIDAGRVVLATGTPILDRGLYFAKLVPYRSYAVAYRMPGDDPRVDGMYISADSPTRSIRTAPIVDADGFGASSDGAGAAGELLLMGGNGHVVGREPHAAGQVEDLDEWTRTYFPGAALLSSWSAQDYVPANPLPFAGWLPRSGGRVYFATGYAKWGMTNAVASGFRIANELLGDEPWWARVIGSRVTRPKSLLRGAIAGAAVGKETVTGWVGAELKSLPETAPAEGTGVVASVHGRPVGRCTVAGRTSTVSAVCPHLGGVLGWNDEAKSWDCPLHGSRFTAEGTRIEGPTTADLAPSAVE